MTIFTHWVHEKNGRAIVLCYATLLCCLFGKKWGLKFTTEPAKKLRKKTVEKFWTWALIYVYLHIIRKGFLRCKIIGQRSKLKTDFLWNFSTAHLCTCPLILVEPYKSGVSFERVFRQMCVCVVWRKFFPKNSREIPTHSHKSGEEQQKRVARVSKKNQYHLIN